MGLPNYYLKNLVKIIYSSIFNLNLINHSNLEKKIFNIFINAEEKNVIFKDHLVLNIKRLNEYKVQSFDFFLRKNNVLLLEDGIKAIKGEEKEEKISEKFIFYN
jgi:hypothetical protein